MSQINDENKGSFNSSTLAKTTLKIAKKSLKSANKVATLALDGLVSQTMICLGCILGFLVLINIILSAIPSGILLKTESDVLTMESNVESAIYDAFISSKNNSKDNTLSFLNESYACKAKKKDLVDNGDGSYALSNDYCEIGVNFTPNLNQITSNVVAYTSAVNGTIDYLSENKELFEPEDYMFEVSEKGELSLSDYGRDVYNANSNEFNNSGSDKFAKVIKDNSSSFFVAEEESKRWDLNNFYLGTKTKYEDYCYVVYANETTNNTTTFAVNCAEASKYSKLTNYKFHKEQIEVKVPCWYGDITIPIYYDLSSYKEEEIINAVDYVNINSNLNEFDSSSFVNSMLNDYYNNYYELLKNGEDDNHSTYFQKLIDDGVIIYVPISGLSSGFIEGEPGYEGEVNVAISGTTIAIWNKIGQLRNKGILSTNATRYNCTEFANYWFYLLYGEGHILSGDGHSIVTNLLNSNYGKEHFYLGSSPAPGGLYSIGSSTSKYGHVGCVDAVDYENKIITISEGNYGGGASGTINTGIRTKVTMTFDEFYQYVNAVGKSQSSWVMFANPKK